MDYLALLSIEFHLLTVGPSEEVVNVFQELSPILSPPTGIDPDQEWTKDKGRTDGYALIYIRISLIRYIFKTG